MYWSKQIILDELIKQGNIALDRGRVISSIDLVKYPGDYPVYSSSAKKNGYFGSYNKFDFDEELITWSVDGGGYFFHRPKHKFSVTNVSGILHILNKEKFDYKFLFYVLDYQHKNQIFDYVDKAHPSIIRKRYFIPEIDIVEQQKIAQILSKVDKTITQTEQLIAKYSRIKKGLMQDLLSNGIDENGLIRNEKTHNFKDSPLGRIPNEWECKFLGKYINIMGGYAFKSNDLVDDGIQLLRMGNLYNNNLSLNRDPIFLSLDFILKHSNFILKKGDIIMSMTGTSGKRDYGFAVEVNIDKPLLLNQRVCKFSFLEDKIDKTYLINLLHYETYLSSLYENASGTKQANLNSENILNIYVPFPSKAEQIKIGEKINALDTTLNVLDSELSKLKSLKRGLMQDLLSGKVRVNHLLKETNE